MNTLIIVLAIILVVGFVYLGINTFLARRQYPHDSLTQTDGVLPELPVNIVHAGSDKACAKVNNEIVLNPIKAVQFKDRKGNVLAPADYDLYKVVGECMQYVNIHHNDLLFATKGIDVEHFSGSLPIIVILKRATTEVGASPFFKLRRLWHICDYGDNLNDILKSIIQSPEFQEVRRRPNYDGDKALIDDFFETRLKKYEKEYIHSEFPNVNDKKIIISTTFHTDIRRVRFSIHPTSNVVGKVEAAFPIDDNCISIKEKTV